MLFFLSVGNGDIALSVYLSLWKPHCLREKDRERDREEEEGDSSQSSQNRDVQKERAQQAWRTIPGHFMPSAVLFIQEPLLWTKHELPVITHNSCVFANWVKLRLPVNTRLSALDCEH